MAAGTAYGVQATLVTATPRTVIDRHYRGTVQVASDTFAAATTNVNDTGDKIHLALVPSNARIRRIIIRNEDLDADATPALTVDVGAYYSGIGHTDKSKTKGTVIDADAFATAHTVLQAANLAGTDVRVHATGTIDETQMEVWEAAGLTADCGGMVFISLTVVTGAATAAAGKIVMDVEFVA